MNEQKLPLKIVEKPNIPQSARKEFNAKNIFVEGKLLETELGELRKKRDGAKLRLIAAREEAETRLTALDLKLEVKREWGTRWAGEEFLYGNKYKFLHSRLELLDDCDHGKNPFDKSEREWALHHRDYDYDRRGETPFVSLSDREIAQKLMSIGIKDLSQESLKDLMTLATEAYNAIETARANLIEKNELDLEILGRTNETYRAYRENIMRLDILRLKAGLGEPGTQS